MKKILVISFLFMGQLSPAAVCSYLEAQMMATVREVQPLPEAGKCRALFSWETRWIYNPAYSCGLDIDEVSSYGVITSCQVQVGDELSGVATRAVEATPQEILLY